MRRAYRCIERSLSIEYGFLVFLQILVVAARQPIHRGQPARQPSNGATRLAANELERAGGWLYVATVGDVPAAAAALTVADGIGYLANAATLPTFRRRGCQRALIAARVADAADAGCDLVTSGATFGSSSQRNLERAGFRLAYTKPVLRLTARTG